MKSVLISIQPKWCELIASGKKTVEVRKTRPKLKTPFKCYIYCTKSKDGILYRRSRNNFLGLGWVYDPLDGKVIGEFVCDKVVQFTNKLYDEALEETVTLSCVPMYDILVYLGKKNCGYGWHISDLVIYDKPRELSEFKPYCDKRCLDGNSCKYHEWIEWYGSDCCTRPKTLTRPPQSWVYVESEGRK